MRESLQSEQIALVRDLLKIHRENCREIDRLLERASRLLDAAKERDAASQADREAMTGFLVDVAAIDPFGRSRSEGS